MQLFGNMLATRTRHLSILQNPPTKNPRLFAAMVCSVSLASIFVYVPAFQTAIGTYPIPAQYWFMPIPLGLFILLCDEVRKLIIRRFPDSLIAKAAW